jgi:nitrate reductase (NAD(P)H)
VIVSIACAGNRRAELMNKYSEIKGLKWTDKAVSNAKFKGALVADVLESYGVKLSDMKGKHLRM